MVGVLGEAMLVHVGGGGGGVVHGRGGGGGDVHGLLLQRIGAEVG